MNFERFELYIERLPLQELEFRNESGVYVLGNFHTKPAWWHVSYESVGRVCRGRYERSRYEIRGLKNVIALIEQRYPDWYAWLVCTFPEEGGIG